MIPRRVGLSRHAGAFTLYALLGWVFVDHGVPVTRMLSGQGSDPYDSPWFLAWWPWALLHHVNPLVTHLVWQPVGVALGWVTSVPALALLGAPVTLLAGAAVTYNLYIILAPVLAAWVAYLLCFRLTRVRAAALVGGFVFGFSSYEMAQDTAALNLCFTVCVPALLLVVLARLDDAIGRGWAVALAAALLILEFLISIEIFAMIFIFGGIAWGFALLLLPQRRAALRRLVVDGLVAAPFVALVLAPFLISMLRHFHAINHPVFWPYYFDADLVNLAVPTPLNAFGCLFTGISKHFNIGTQEQDAYIGLPLLVMVWMFARESGRQPRGHFLVLLWLLFLLLSFGPRLWVAGHYSPIVLPWMLVVNLPLLGAALPGRFALFVSLVSAVIAAYWIAAPGAPRWRLALGVLACVSLAPSLHPWRAMPTSAFFAPGRVQAVLGPNPRILILPFAINGPSSFWQQENQFGFTQTGGYLGFPPAAMQKYKAVGELFGNYEKPGFASDLQYFCQQTRTQFVVAGPGTQMPVLAALNALGWLARRVDDVVIYTVPAGG